MYKDVLRDIDGIEVYPLFSLFVFVVFFLALGIYVAKMKRPYIEEMKQKPLDCEDEMLSRKKEINHA